MVYDEGFDVNIQDYSFFAFSKYAPNPRKNPFSSKKKDKFISMCYSTLIGWFHTDNKKWGCFYGHKLGVNYHEPTNGEADDKLLVVENVIKPAFIEKEVNENLEIETEGKNFLKNFLNQ